MEQTTSPSSTQRLFTEADQLLEVAKHELERSQEDVVVPMVCFNTRLSISNYLRGFLLAHSCTPISPLSLEHLLAQCRHHDAAFRQLDFLAIECRHEDDDESYCLSADKVKECVGIAEQTREIVRRCPSTSSGTKGEKARKVRK
ncbi:MAG TPA: HEPN domain-containing protein [Saprospiraceae bacterium]|nr:HEPN domain-containing protein [Saprospiraceae bacterium]